MTAYHPLIVHHMGALENSSNPTDPHSPPFPPNSLEAIRACLEVNAPFIEIDITALADSDYLLVHDPVLESETTGFGAVGGCTTAQARSLFLKSGPLGEPLPYRPAFLSDVVTLFGAFPKSNTRLQLDFKNVYPFFGDEPLRRLIDLLQPLGNRAIVSTGADWQLRQLHTLAPWLDLGLDIHFYIDYRPQGTLFDPRQPPFRCGVQGYWDDHPLAMFPFWGKTDYLAERCAYILDSVPYVSTFYVSYRFLLQSLSDGFDWTAAAHARSIRIDAYTLDLRGPDQIATANQLIAVGVDQFTTNFPRAFAVLLNGQTQKTAVV